MSALSASTRKYAPEERDRLILEGLPQVKWIAARIHEKIMGREDLDDLVSAGTIGLIAAIDRFDPERNVQLKTYAEYKIRGAIVDYLRSRDGLSRDDRKRSKETAAARAGLEGRLQRAATDAEVAEEMGLSPRADAETLTAPGARPPFSLDAHVKGTDGRLNFSEVLPDSSTPSPEQKLAESELQDLVSVAIHALEPRTRAVITLHYAGGLTMRKIAPILEMSEWQVQEARRKAIGELRASLAPFMFIPPAQPSPTPAAH
jgi:RNA polymerase sigma factor for flagellar operon FliA